MLFCWDDNEGGNVDHIAEQGLTPDEVESAFDDIRRHTTSRSTGRPALFGTTFKADVIFVVYDIEIDTHGDEYVFVCTAYAKEDKE